MVRMKVKASNSDAVRLIRFSAFLWIGYIIALVIINQSFSGPQRTDPLYYALLGDIALVCLGLSYWSWLQRKMGRAFLPVIIFIITVMPVIVNQSLGLLYPLGPRFESQEGSVLAVFPFLFVALLLVAWKYRWQYILLVILVIAGLNFFTVWYPSRPGDPSYMGGLIVTLIQAVIFLAVGFSISYLMSRLRSQQQSLEAANVRLSHYASTLEQLATTRERNRVARELHDTLAHTLSGLSVQLETVKAYWDVDEKKARGMLDKVLEAAHAGLEETRRALKALRASPLDDLGLALAIGALAEDTAARAHLELELSVPETIPSLSPDVEQCIYRVTQEAVTNTANHAGAKKLTVKLESGDGKTTLTVSDDGAGFNLEKTEKSGRLGLVGIRERAELAGGKLAVTSQPGEGTTISLII